MKKKIQNKYLTFSFCNPSRGPTSTTFTKLGRPATCKHQNQNLVKSNSEKNKIIRRTQQEENNAWNDKRVEHEGPFLECPWWPKFIHSPGISGIDKYYFFFPWRKNKNYQKCLFLLITEEKNIKPNRNLMAE